MTLPTYHRQLFVIDDSSSKAVPGENDNFEIHKFHHPILMYKEDRSRILLYLMCHVGTKNIFNVFRKEKKSWITSLDTQSLELEK